MGWLFINILLLAVLLIACSTDLAQQKIYNWLLFPALLAALALHVLDSGWRGFIFWGEGLILGLVLLVIPFIAGGLGAGDVKLLGVVGAFKGVVFVAQAFLAAALAGGILSLLMLAYHKKLRHTLSVVGRGLKVFFFSGFKVWNFAGLGSDNSETIRMPYGLAITLGALSVYLTI